MSHWYNDNHKPIIPALIIFCLLFGLVLFLSLRYDFSKIDSGGLLFVVTTFCCFLIAKNTYDEARITEQQMNDPRFSIVPTDLPLSVETYTELYQNSPVPYLVLNRIGVVESANTAALRMFGITKAKLLQQNIFEFIAGETPGSLDVLVEKYRSGVAVSDVLVRVRRSDHREAWALLSLFTFSHRAGSSAGLLTLVDITKQKRAEDAKSAFVSLASHQLRTPIAGMKWSVELLEMDEEAGTLAPRQRKYVDRLLTSINRMAVLVDDFLRVSRFELGNFTPAYETISLSSVCDEVISDLAAVVAQKSLMVQKEYDTQIDKMVLDPNLMRMIVTNLYSNAIKYTPPHGTVLLQFGRRDRALVVTVTDSGMGIPEADQEQIFSKLFRASNAVRDVPDGTGLGLYIVREAVAVLGGNISFTSTENLGTTFVVVLPLRLPEE